MSSSEIQFLARNKDLPPLAYVKKGGSKQPTVVFCNGFGQNMDNPLALALERFLCDEGGYPFIRFDYTDTGSSIFAMAKFDNRWTLMNAADDEVTRKEIIDDSLPSALAATYKNCPDKMKADDPRQWSFYAWRRDVLTVLRRLLKVDNYFVKMSDSKTLKSTLS
uniref:Uncharacterized protein n=1 Tax=Plectus sambesii TaxID=2011161 RepID=A0A914XMD9_9BILA